MKYIPSEKLIADIEEKIKNFSIIHNTAASKNDYESMSRVDCAIAQLRNVLALAESLQRENPEADFEKELCEYFEGWRINYYSETEELLKNNGCTVDIDDVKEIARHFYELGLNARKE